MIGLVASASPNCHVETGFTFYHLRNKPPDSLAVFGSMGVEAKEGTTYVAIPVIVKLWGIVNKEVQNYVFS